MARRKMIVREEGQFGRSKGKTGTLGYFYRAGRGWCRSTDKKPLRGEDGKPLVDRSLSDAFLRSRLEAMATAPTVAMVSVAEAEGQSKYNIFELQKLYVAEKFKRGKKKNRPLSARTIEIKSNFLFDFYSGFPESCRPAFEATAIPPDESKRVHKGFGGLPVSKLRQHHVDEWVASHTEWAPTGKGRMAKKQIEGMLNWAKEKKLIDSFPFDLSQMSIEDGKARECYIEADVQAVLLSHCSHDLAEAIEFLIGTGMRPGKEFCQTTIAQVRDLTLIEWKEGSKVQGKPRTVEIPDYLAGYLDRSLKNAVRGQPIFCNAKGKPWTYKNLESRFKTALGKTIAELQPKFDGTIREKELGKLVFYATRHTFAKRHAGGFTDTVHNLKIEAKSIGTVAELMGITEKVCFNVYGRLSGARREPLRQAVNGTAIKPMNLEDMPREQLIKLLRESQLVA